MSNVPCDKTAIVEQLKLIEEHVRQIEQMLSKGEYCVAVLERLADVNSATREVGMAILEGQMKTCLHDALTSDRREDAVKELVEVVERFM